MQGLGVLRRNTIAGTEIEAWRMEGTGVQWGPHTWGQWGLLQSLVSSDHNAMMPFFWATEMEVPKRKQKLQLHPQ